MTSVATFRAEDCQHWIETCAVNGLVRVSDIARSLRTAAVPRPDIGAIATALEAFAAEHPTQYAPRFVASAAAADGRHLVARVLLRSDAAGAVGAMCAKAGCPAVPETALCIRLDAVTAVKPTTVDDDDAAAVAPACPAMARSPTSPLNRMASVDALAHRSAARGPALLRASSAVVERMYRTFSRLQLRSGDLSASSSSETLKPAAPGPSSAPAAKAAAPAPSSAPAQPPKRAARPVDVHPEPESKTARAEVKLEVADVVVAATAAPTTPAPQAPKPKAAGNLMAWLQKKPTPAAATATPTTPVSTTPATATLPSGGSDGPLEEEEPSSAHTAPTDAGSEQQQQQQQAKPKRGRPVMTAEEKAEAALKRQATKAAAIGIGAKVASAVPAAKADNCHALIDDDDDDDNANVLVVPRPEEKEEDTTANDVPAASGVSRTLDADDDDAPIALAMVASVPKQTPAAAAAAARKAKKDLEEARAKELERHQLELYELECARVAAGAAGGDDDSGFVAEAGTAAVPAVPAFELSEEAKSTAVPPPPPQVRIATSTVTPPTTRKHARPASSAASAAQPTLAAFASSGNAAAELQKSFERTVEEVTEQVNGEYVCRDVVVFVHRESKEQITDDEFRRRLAECMATAATADAEKSPSTAVKRLAADDVEMDESAPLPTPVEPKVVQLKPKDSNTAAAAAKASGTKAAAGKKTAAKSTAPPAGTRSIASFFAPKK